MEFLKIYHFYNFDIFYHRIFIYIPIKNRGYLASSFGFGKWASSNEDSERSGERGSRLVGSWNSIDKI
jgi:hypothetical protein